ncbi:hypothetical protein Rxycam_00229 [Rubrobacter xylanophilus DSM 9941]|nr:hypothetical protein Rxycam_00229 [Rubrobacter xylanophilus DSM 9941]
MNGTFYVGITLLIMVLLFILMSVGPLLTNF